MSAITIKKFGYPRKDKFQIKKGLECCHTGNGCQYETDPNCPYRITNASCDRAGLIADASEMIAELEGDNESLRECITNAAKILGYDCDECDRW